METAQIQYQEKFEGLSEKQYDEVNAWVGMNLTHHKRHDEKYSYYFLDAEETQIVRFHRRERTVELTDRIDKDTVMIIRHIIDTGIRRNDVK